MKTSEKPPDALTRESFTRVRELFNRTVELGPEERLAVLDRECADDEYLRSSVLKLLLSSSETESKLNPGDGAIMRQLLESRPASAPLQHVGPYRIQRVLGRGGMGTVYLAEQANPERPVALKILRAAHLSESLRRRFGREVRVLGRLEHPGIARIYEAGTALSTEGPVSYFAMEYVDGPRLTSYATEMNLGTRDRVELVARIADAVQHAHTKGVIHRDLKPANILVHAGGASTSGSPAGAADAQHHARSVAQPKILDFGVARLLEPDTQHTAITEEGLLVGTVAYMSPEQLEGDNDAVDARADVYAMGVVLYELLTGRLPHEVRGKPVAEAARLVRDAEPAPLNSPGNGGAESFDRDLGTIVARAMEKDRERRYATAEAFAEDLRRYLRDEPILARPPTLAYQLSKFVRRHRALVTVTATALLALVAALAWSTAMFLREQDARRREEAARVQVEESLAREHDALRVAVDKDTLSTAVKDYLITELLMAPSPDRMGYDVGMLDVLLQAGEGLHDRFVDQPEMEIEIRTALAEVLVSLGRDEEAGAHRAIIVSLLERTVGPNDPRTMSATLLWSDHVQRGAPRLKVVKEVLDRAASVLPKDHPVAIDALRRVALVHISLNQFGRGLGELNAALGVAERAREQNAELIIEILNGIRWCHSKRRDTQGMLDASRRILETIPGLFGPDDPRAIELKRVSMDAFLQNGLLEEALALAPELAGAAERVLAPPRRDGVYTSVAAVYLAANRFEDAERFALLAYDLSSRSGQRPTTACEAGIKTLRQLYSKWPGRQERVSEWGVTGLRARLMLANKRQLATITEELDAFCAESARAGSPVSRAEAMELLWRRRDELAPPGHALRAAFLANFARLCTRTGNPQHTQEAIAFAEAALPDANPQPRAEALVAAAKTAAR